MLTKDEKEQLRLKVNAMAAAYDALARFRGWPAELKPEIADLVEAASRSRIALHHFIETEL